MNNKNQTSVDWLQMEIYEIINPIIHQLTKNQRVLLSDAVKVAKLRNKQEIMQAVYDSMGTNFDPNMGRAEQYYNEKFKN